MQKLIHKTTGELVSINPFEIPGTKIRYYSNEHRCFKYGLITEESLAWGEKSGYLERGWICAMFQVQPGYSCPDGPWKSYPNKLKLGIEAEVVEEANETLA